MIVINYKSDIQFHFTSKDKRYITNHYNTVSNVYKEYSGNHFSYLFKFTNDMSGDVIYAYPKTDMILPDHTPRAYKLLFAHTNSPNIFEDFGINGAVNLKAGYYSYHAYEVFFNNIRYKRADVNFMPMNERNEFHNTASNTTFAGKVTGLVEVGKLLSLETQGEEEIQYKKHTETTTNYIYNG